MSSNYKKEKFKLRPRARIVKTFGEELISNDYVAIIELIKNSYDADSHLVEINFKGPLEKGMGSITIIDDGIGMSPDEVKIGWMEPASISKFSNRKSKGGRPFLGQKGIGRFSAAKLAENLILTTRKKSSDEEVVVNFKWSDYYNPNKYLDQIEGWWEIKSPNQIEKQGTILNMENLLSTWTTERIEELGAYLRRLINPIGSPKDFKIKVLFPEEFKKYSGDITPTETVENPDYLIKGKLDVKGFLYAEYKSKRNTKIEILHNGEIILESGNVPNFGPIEFEFRVWDRDRLKTLAEEIGSSLSEARKDLDAIAGVNIYRDGFRVSPYGNRENDWLRLDLRRVQNPTMRLSNNQIVGNISITDKNNPEFTDQTNREGIVESDSFRDLQEVTRTILTFLENKRYDERRDVPEEDESEHKKLFTDIDLNTVKEVVEKKLPGDKEVQEVIIEKEAEIKKKVEEFKDFIVDFQR